MTDDQAGQHNAAVSSAYGGWPSRVSAQSLVEGVVGLSALQTCGEVVYWLESRPEEAGRTVLISRQGGENRELTPAPFNIRSRVHEYGGGAFTASAERIFFVNFKDQNIYSIAAEGSFDAEGSSAGARIVQLTHSEPTTRFADFILDEANNRLISIVEQHQQNRQPDNFIGAVDLSSGELTVLAGSHDFYSTPRLTADGGRLAFIAWDHPNMPWDGTVLQVATIAADGSLEQISTVAGGVEESVQQPSWQSNESLLFLSDSNGFWNLYRFDSSGIYCVLEDGSEYADAPWALGMHSYTLLDEVHVLLTRQSDSGQELALVNTQTTLATPFQGDDSPWCSYSSLSTSSGDLYFIGSYPDRSPTIEQLPLGGGPSETLQSCGGPLLDPADVSVGLHIRFPTRDGMEAHGFFYAPTSSTQQGLPGTQPPLVVMSHGGPTSAASNSLSLRIQYYTTRGWAVLDVNYRGSTGFGRAYRCALNGRWGELDVTDCEDGVRFLARTGRINPEQVAIRGGSAGGYTTLAALTTTDCFRVGASHYGIGDLSALADDTHKFESRYLEGLLGDSSALIERSPINHLDRFRCPVIFFQGSEDKVVPPNQSRAMAEALRSKGIPVAYLEFPGEGHGFRDAGNIIQAVESEFGFFCRVFGIEAADDLPAIDIDNAENLRMFKETLRP